MNRSQVMERIDRVAATCVSTTADHGQLTAALDDVARLESWTAARRAELVRLLKIRPGAFPEADIADSTGTTLGAATKETERAETLDAADAFADALDDGDIRPGHVDALTRTCNQLTDEQTQQLLADQDKLAKQAAQSSISAFTKYLKRRAAQLQTERDAEQRLERQRRATRLRTWVDDTDGMWCLSGRFDPDTGRHLHRLLDNAVRNLFGETVPDTAPDDPIERQQHLNALALVDLINGNVSTGSRPGPPLVVVDTTAHATRNTHTDTGTVEPLGVDWGLPIELPLSVLRDVFDTHTPDVIIVANGIILHAPGTLNLGRTTRLANKHQRQALRALYSTCAVPGCSVHYDRCKLHHIIWWRHGGTTDLHNLLPVCQHHHTQIHQDNWHIELTPNRHLTITLGDGRTLTGHPTRTHKPRAASRGLWRVGEPTEDNKVHRRSRAGSR